ncbi:MAG: PTS sugar transporter subunit IIC [Elusimicrobia bacterium]|nr:PTS sugar transporter subunit IIC [Elusimicrobiota bacterium]
MTAWVVALVGATLHLDTLAVGQWMVSRPLVVGPCLGWLFGDAWTGFLIGAWIELLWVRAIPVGLDVPQDLCGMTVLATGWYGRTLDQGTGGVGLAVLSLTLAALWGPIGRWCDLKLRRMNLWFANRVDQRLTHGDNPALGRTISLAIGLRWLVMATCYWLALEGGGWVLGAMVPRWGGFLLGKLEMVAWLLPFAGLAVVVQWFLHRPAAGWGIK